MILCELYCAVQKHIPFTQNLHVLWVSECTIIPTQDEYNNFETLINEGQYDKFCHILYENKDPLWNVCV